MSTLVCAQALREVYAPTADEVALGWVFGPADDTAQVGPPPEEHPPRTARQALEDVLLPLLASGPTSVAFSGGRDSSALLALMVHLARREGLPEPVALTLRTPDDPASDETQWQQLVVDHIRVRAWERLDVSDGRSATLGPLGRRVLAAAGHPTFPAGATGGAYLASLATGGALVAGEFGDNVLGRRRVTAAANVWRRRGRVPRSDWATALRDLVPPTVRPRPTGDDLPWLRPAANRRRRVGLVAEQRATRLHWARDVRAEARRAWWVHGLQTLRAVAATVGTQRHDPFADPTFLAAWTRAGGATGPLSRTTAMRALVGDLLPDAVLGRRGKATFNGMHFGVAARELAEQWDGEGVDPDLVDVTALRQEWRSDVPHAASLGLLQQAWLHLHESAT